MLSAGDDELLTRVGLGTRVGNVMRQHRLPVMQSHEIPDSDGDPMRVRLLSEDVILFRAAANDFHHLAAAQEVAPKTEAWSFVWKKNVPVA